MSRDVAGAVQQQTKGGLAVPSRTPSFLVVVVQRGRQAGVDNEAHVALVDAHAKGHSGNDHVDPSLNPGGMDSLTRRGVQVSVVERTRHAALGQAYLPGLS